jgi:6-phosphogluconolactonase
MSIHSFIYKDASEASEACAVKVAELLRQAVAAKPSAAFAVSGGTTPKLLFRELAKIRLEWDKVHLFWVDERCVPPTDAQSNYKLAKENFIDPAGFPSRNVHRVPTELDPEGAARSYADEIREFFGSGPDELPHFDVIHRGMGPDAHTASLFPGEPLIGDLENLTAAVYVEKFHQWRVTLLPGVLLAARNTVMLVAGEDKAEPLHAVLHEPYDPLKLPAQIATYQGRNQVMWFLDEAAARLIR